MDAELLYLTWQAAEEKQLQRNIMLARHYFDGEHEVPLTERQKEYLGFNTAKPRFAANFCRVIVNAVVERLIVDGFDSDDEILSAWAESLWQANRMDATARLVHQMAVRDGEAFLLVDWDDNEKRPRFIAHPRYVDAMQGGTGYGCKAHYPDDDDTQPMLYASKRWTETITNERGQRETRQRLTAYYPERVERYVLATTGSEAGWQQYRDKGQTEWPTPWVTTAGDPLGIPAIHFRNPHLRSELWDAVPLQDAINKVLLDIMASADTSGFRLLFASGWLPTTDGALPATDGSNLLKISPGQIVGTSKDGASLTPIEGADLAPMLETADSLIMKLAQITDTPTGRFQMTRAVAAEGTLKQQEAPLLGKVRAREVLFGDAWEDMLYLARRLTNTFGGESIGEESLLETRWKPSESRDEAEWIATLAIKREKLMVPLEQIWSEVGYSGEQIAKMMSSPEYRARIDALGSLSNQQVTGNTDAVNNERTSDANRA